MARKPRIHIPGGFYHVILRGNGGQDIFNSKADRSRFYLLIQEGIERYRYRVHSFCLMTNHVHLLIEVWTIPLSRIMQNLSFRYTRYINATQKRIGHLFQGRYKALLIDADRYLLELSRYIHCNPARAGLVSNPSQYPWSSCLAYLGLTEIPWLTTEPVLSRFASQANKAHDLYSKFVQDGITESHRQDFHTGTYEGRILGDDHFGEKVLSQAEEEAKCRITLVDVIRATCSIYGINKNTFSEPGKKQPTAEARAGVDFLVQEREGMMLTELGRFVGRDIAALSRSAGRIHKKLETDSELCDTLNKINQTLGQILKCQA